MGRPDPSKLAGKHDHICLFEGLELFSVIDETKELRSSTEHQSNEENVIVAGGSVK